MHTGTGVIMYTSHVFNSVACFFFLGAVFNTCICSSHNSSILLLPNARVRTHTRTLARTHIHTHTHTLSLSVSIYLSLSVCLSVLGKESQCQMVNSHMRSSNMNRVSLHPSATLKVLPFSQSYSSVRPSAKKCFLMEQMEPQTQAAKYTIPLIPYFKKFGHI